MEQSALKAVIDLVEVSQLVNLPELLQHSVVEECVALFNSYGTYRKTQKSKLIQKLSLQSVDLQEPCTARIYMGMIWRMVTPSVGDRQTQEGTPPYKWSDYVHKVSSINFGRHCDAERIICVNDPYNAEYSPKVDERDLRVQGKAHVPNTYMKLGHSFTSATAFKTLLRNDSNRIWWMVAVILYATHSLLSQCIYLHQGQLKIVEVRMRRKEMIVCRRGGRIHQRINQSLTVQRQNALI